MKSIESINGLTTECKNGHRRVFYMGQECPSVGDRESLCEGETSFVGEVMDQWQTWKTPIGVVERRYRARGAALELTSTTWRLVPALEIQALQTRHESLSEELSIVEAQLRLYTK